MIIAQISDTHLALDTPDAERRIADFERTIDDINSLDPAPDLIIHSGDIVQNAREDEYAEAARILALAKVPVYLMVGNKDDRSKLREAFPDHAYLQSCGDFIAYSIDEHPIRIIVLDTLNPGSNKGDFCDERIAALVREYDRDSQKPVAVFAHHPPFLVDEGPDPLHFETDDIMQNFRRVLGSCSRLSGVFCGHVHRGVAGLVNSVRVLVVPCIATTLRRGEYPPHLTTCPIYHLHRFDDDGEFSSELRIVGDLYSGQVA